MSPGKDPQRNQGGPFVFVCRVDMCSGGGPATSCYSKKSLLPKQRMPVGNKVISSSSERNKHPGCERRFYFLSQPCCDDLPTMAFSCKKNLNGSNKHQVKHSQLSGDANRKLGSSLPTPQTPGLRTRNQGGIIFLKIKYRTKKIANLSKFHYKHQIFQTVLLVPFRFGFSKVQP